jgi:hypothetical protein
MVRKRRFIVGFGHEALSKREWFGRRTATITEWPPKKSLTPNVADRTLRCMVLLFAFGELRPDTPQNRFVSFFAISNHLPDFSVFESERNSFLIAASSQLHQPTLPRCLP